MFMYVFFRGGGISAGFFLSFFYLECALNAAAFVLQEVSPPKKLCWSYRRREKGLMLTSCHVHEQDGASQKICTSKGVSDFFFFC